MFYPVCTIIDQMWAKINTKYDTHYQPNLQVKKNELTQDVVYYILSNHRALVFGENQFFSFWGAQKNIFEPLKTHLATETPLLGGSYF